MEQNVIFSLKFPGKHVIPAAHIHGCNEAYQGFVYVHPVLNKDRSRRHQFKALVDLLFLFFLLCSDLVTKKVII